MRYEQRPGCEIKHVFHEAPEPRPYLLRPVSETGHEFKGNIPMQISCL